MRSGTNVRFKRDLHKIRPLLIGALGIVAVLILAITVFSRLTVPVPYTQSILITGEKTYIVSFSAAGNKVTMLAIPERTVIKGARGYGNYSIEALSSLDVIDKRNGTLLVESVADAFGIPVMGVVDAGSGTSGEARNVLTRIFSWSSLFPKGAATITSIPLGQRLRYVQIVQSLPPDGLSFVDASAAVVSETLPDGSTASVLDEAKLDFILGKSFIDTGLRGEGFTVALYNAANIPLVGSRTSRLLTRLGIQLVYVGNAPGPHKDCQMHGNEKSLRSDTARFIRDYFRCVDEKAGTIGSETGADLIVELGEDYAERFK